jgi:dipeptidyl aminopeptidase/acylaminoacyl peptidase
MIFTCALFAWLVPVLALVAQETPGPAGTIVHDEIHYLSKRYSELDAFGRSYFIEKFYEEARTQTMYERHRIWYWSDGLRVEGYLYRPRDLGNRKWPIIIYNRGGTGDYGAIDDLLLVEMYLLAREGYVVLASNYRWRGDLARRDEWGGGDLNDVLNLFPLARNLGYVDMENAFMIGGSRGGTMTYLALKANAPVRAAVVIAGPSDLKRFADYRPEFEKGSDDYDGWAKVWPDFEHRKEEHYCSRSAVCWPEKIGAPVLILHSRSDKLVPATQALLMAEKLQELKKEYELIIYGTDGHSLPLNRDDRLHHVIEWLRRHSTPQH